ncbi:predicted protein [Histoplasma capsulatum H143]|uniref:Uncharacterized protein n=1 Tax=Ajellomyces capsulatus (strain H143) TaxID=544712 RepID=C6HAG3_AJECH|nr:predicted protein [Histoplasma capsulatum H143]
MDVILSETVRYTASTVFALSVSFLKLSADLFLGFAFGLSGLLLIIFGLCITSSSLDPDVDEHDDSIQLSDSLLYSPSDISHKALEKLRKLTCAQTRRVSLIIRLAICALALRIEVLRRTLQNSECMKSASFCLHWL